MVMDFFSLDPKFALAELFSFFMNFTFCYTEPATTACFSDMDQEPS